jgi:hypothetical protein
VSEDMKMSTEQNKPLPPWEQARRDFVDEMAAAYSAASRDDRERVYAEWRERYQQMAAAGTFSPPAPQRKKFLGLI